MVDSSIFDSYSLTLSVLKHGVNFVICFFSFVPTTGSHPYESVYVRKVLHFVPNNLNWLGTSGINRKKILITFKRIEESKDIVFSY